MPGFYEMGQPDIAERMFRSLGLVGDLSGRLLGDITPIMAVEDLRTPEFDWGRRFKRLQSGDLAPAVAGQNSYVGLWPSATAVARGRYLAVVDRIIIANENASAQPMLFGMVGALSTPAGTGSSNAGDDRWPGASPGGGQTQSMLAVVPGQSATPAVPNPTCRLVLPAGASIVLDWGWVLTGRLSNLAAPFGLSVQTVNVNISLSVTYQWRERDILTSETT